MSLLQCSNIQLEQKLSASVLIAALKLELDTLEALLSHSLTETMWKSLQLVNRLK